MKINKKMCSTCPWQPGSKYAYLLPHLTQSALTEATRICHQTGSGNGINYRTGKPPAGCRGARDLQLRTFKANGFIEAATDAAWNKKCRQLGIQPNAGGRKHS